MDIGLEFTNITIQVVGIMEFFIVKVTKVMGIDTPLGSTPSEADPSEADDWLILILGPY